MHPTPLKSMPPRPTESVTTRHPSYASGLFSLLLRSHLLGRRPPLQFLPTVARPVTLAGTYNQCPAVWLEQHQVAPVGEPNLCALTKLWLRVPRRIIHRDVKLDNILLAGVQLARSQFAILICFLRLTG